MNFTKKTALAVTASLILIAALAGCGSEPTGTHASGSHTSRAGAASVSSAPRITYLAARETLPTGEFFLGELTSQRGTNLLGPYPVTTSQVAVSADCVGKGSVVVTIEGVGTFPVRCGAEPGVAAVRNTFDVRDVSEITVLAQGDDSLEWRLSVTAVATE